MLTVAMVYARPHFGIIRLLVWDIPQKNTWVCLQSHDKTAWARPVKSTGWKTRWGESERPLVLEIFRNVLNNISTLQGGRSLTVMCS